MSEARAITNLIGNGVACVAVSKWEGELDTERAQKVLDKEIIEDIIHDVEIVPETPPALAHHG
jgi:aerobic C4-dicarboxylate transport protein